MYRFSEDLDLQEIVGSEIQQICVGRYDVQFHFHSGTSIGGQADVTLLDGAEEIGRWTEDANWSTLAFQKLLNITITNYSVPNDRVLRIEFDNGLVLELHDSSDQYESFLITKPDGAMIVV
jgi:hypothetical protein